MATIGNIGYLSLPVLPKIIGEWCAIVPLVVHLASLHDEFQVIGDACLRGKFALDLIPKLGQLKGMAKILRPGSVTLDQTSGAGVASSTTVWDVSWGSVFQCANGAARDLITTHAFRGHTRIIDVETTLPGSANGPYSASSDLGVNITQLNKKSSIPSAIPKNIAFCRPQVLHLVELQFSTSRSSNVAANSRLVECIYKAFRHLAVTASVVPLSLCGAYGTCALVLFSRLNALVNHHLPVSRPPRYLQNNETYSSTCMLTAPHENASTWYLYRGDRAIIDWLLNKTMIVIGVPGGSRGIYLYFLVSHYLQLLAMTYVAAQKGCDGLFLLLLMILSSLTGSNAMPGLGWLCRSGAATWLHQNNIDVRTSTFRIARRTQMMGAIQLINDMDQAKNPSAQRSEPHSTPESVLSGPHRMRPENGGSLAKWRDTIICLSPRRDVWLQRLRILVQRQQLGDTPMTRGSDSSTKEGPRLLMHLTPSLSFLTAPTYNARVSHPSAVFLI